MILLQLFLSFVKIGFLGFGGGMAILPMIYQEISEFSDMTQAEFANLVAVSQATPGPIAVNAATYVGYQEAGFLGSLVATVGVSIPALLLVVITVKLLTAFKESPVVKGAMMGIRPAAVGLVASAVVFIAIGTIFTAPLSSIRDMNSAAASLNFTAIAIAAVTFFLAVKFKLSPIKLILAMGVLGAVVLS